MTFMSKGTGTQDSVWLRDVPCGSAVDTAERCDIALAEWGRGGGFGGWQYRMVWIGLDCFKQRTDGCYVANHTQLKHNMWTKCKYFKLRSRRCI